MGLWGGAGDGPLTLEPPTRWAAPWKSPSSRLGPSAGPSLLPPWPLQGHYDPPLTQGEVGTEAGGQRAGLLCAGCQGCSHKGARDSWPGQPGPSQGWRALGSATLSGSGRLRWVMFGLGGFGGGTSTRSLGSKNAVGLETTRNQL